MQRRADVFASSNKSEKVTMSLVTSTPRPATPPPEPGSAPLPRWARASRFRAFAVLIVVISSTSCDRSVPLTSPVPRASRESNLAAVPEINDRTMGRLSHLALQIVVALRDPTLRAKVAAYMKSKEGGLLGLSLSECGTRFVTT